jgi:hypothetical protein
MSLQHEVAKHVDDQPDQENSHEGEKFLTTRRHPSLFLDGAGMAVVSDSETGVRVGLSALVSVPVSICWLAKCPGTAGALTAGLSMSLFWYYKRLPAWASDVAFAMKCHW